MRRIFATIALLLIGWTTVEPAALAALVSSSVPICCRKGGKHHCTGSPSDNATDGNVRLHAVSLVCPHRSQALAPSAHFQLQTPSPFEHQPLLVQSAISMRDTQAQFSVSFSQRFERGPPQYSLLIAS
jgi:hypothetical protein